MKILYIMPAAPFPHDRGTAQRTDLLYRALRDLGEVDTVLLRARHEPAADAALLERLRDEYSLIGSLRLRARGEIGAWSLVRRIAGRRVDRIARGLGDADAEHRAAAPLRAWLTCQLRRRGYDLIVGRYLSVLGPTGALEQSRVPVALDVDDLPTEMCRSRLATSRRHGLAHYLEQRRLERLERTLPRHFSRCAALWVASDEHLREPGLERAQHLPNIPYFPEGLPAPLPANAGSKRLLFVGTFSHNPNLQGIGHFVERIWPKILAEEPEARLTLVGSKLSDAQRSQYTAMPNVEPLGFVENLRDAYARAAFSIIPVYSGSGTNIKLPESLAYGRTAVITRFAHRGHRQALPQGAALRVAESDAEFAAQVLELLEHPGEARRLGEFGRRCVEEHYSFARFKAAVHAPLKDHLRRVDWNPLSNPATAAEAQQV